MFPISDSIKSGKIPFVVIAIIAANLYVFYQQIMNPGQNELINTYALTPNLVDFFNPTTLTTFVTSMFLHGGFFHLASNMWFLWVFGDNAEIHLGRLKFILIYLLSGIAGAFAQYLLNPSSLIPIVGASAAISGILASYVTLFPGARIKSFLVLFFFITVTEIPAVIYIFYWFFIQLISGIATIPFAMSETGGVAFWAHVGGFLAGLFLTRIFKNPSKKEGIIEGELVE